MFKNLVITLGFVLCMNMLYAQQYSYSFSGQIEEEVLSAMVIDIAKLEGVKEVKWRYKPERMAGEVLIFTEESKDRSNPFPFSPIRVKELMSERGLTPMEFTEIKSNRE